MEKKTNEGRAVYKSYFIKNTVRNISIQRGKWALRLFGPGTFVLCISL